MKADLKICLPFYKVIYSIIFVVLLSFIRSISSVSEIGPTMDSNIALLAIIICSDTFWQELKGSRYEIFSRISFQKKKRVIINRLLCEVIYLILITAISYWLFYLQKPYMSEENSHLEFYIMALGAITGSILFFGSLSIFITHIMQNIWVGIGISGIIWLFFNSKYAVNIFPKMFHIFAYANRSFPEEIYDFSWICGKLIAVFWGIILFIIQLVFIKKGNGFSYVNRS